MTAQRGHFELLDELAFVLHGQGCREDSDGSGCAGICVDDAKALLPLVQRYAAERVEAAALAVEELRPHIPPSTDPDQRTRIVQRSSFNRAASAVRAVAEGDKP